MIANPSKLDFWAVPLAAFLITFFFVWLMARSGESLGFIDLPNTRSSHRNKTPKGGGIGMLISFGVLGLYLKMPLNMVLPAVGLSLLSFWGDLRDIAPKFRLVAQILASGFVIAAQPSMNANPMGWALSLIFMVYLVGTANMYNFMDGINGIAGVTGLIGFGLLALKAGETKSAETILMSMDPGAGSYPLLLLGIMAGLLGFLPFNFPHARIFMGDVGSILLGFVYATFVLYLSRNSVDFVCYSAFIYPFYADELITMGVRLKNGENLILPHRKHLYQILANEYRIPHWKVTLLFAGFQLIVGLLLFKAEPKGMEPVIAILTGATVVFGFFSYQVRKRYQDRRLIKA